MIIFFPLPFIVMGLAPVVITHVPSFLLGNAKERVVGVVMIVPTVVLGIVVVPLHFCGFGRLTNEMEVLHESAAREHMYPRIGPLVSFWKTECPARVKKIFTSRQQTEAHATLMLKVFAVQVREERARRQNARV